MKFYTMLKWVYTAIIALMIAKDAIVIMPIALALIVIGIASLAAFSLFSFIEDNSPKWILVWSGCLCTLLCLIFVV